MSASSFAHASEAELARILDYYQVEWQYEPRTFPILYNLDGEVVESFAPDFYLPEFDLYVELTTLKQSLVRKKNRKLRRLRELYPDVRIKLFYARDFKALLLKYGRFDLAASLSGEEGQARPTDPDSGVQGASPASLSTDEHRAPPIDTPDTQEPAAASADPASPAAPAGATHLGRSRRHRRRRRGATAIG
ncbi:MAG: hypothetical protein ABWY52_03210 [Candidatus Limnocylindrales bacterium]